MHNPPALPPAKATPPACSSPEHLLPDAVLQDLFHVVVAQPTVLCGEKEVVRPAGAIPKGELALHVARYSLQVGGSYGCVAGVVVPARAGPEGSAKGCAHCLHFYSLCGG